MKLIALITLLCCGTAFAADPLPPDAPVAEHACGTRETDPDARGCAVQLKKGEVAPFEAEAADEQERVRRSRRDARWLGELDDAHKSWLLPKPLFVTIIVGAVILSAGLSAGVVYAADHPKR